MMDAAAQCALAAASPTYALLHLLGRPTVRLLTQPGPQIQQAHQLHSGRERVPAWSFIAHMMQAGRAADAGYPATEHGRCHAVATTKELKQQPKRELELSDAAPTSVPSVRSVASLPSPHSSGALPAHGSPAAGFSPRSTWAAPPASPSPYGHTPSPQAGHFTIPTARRSPAGLVSGKAASLLAVFGAARHISMSPGGPAALDRTPLLPAAATAAATRKTPLTHQAGRTGSGEHGVLGNQHDDAGDYYGSADKDSQVPHPLSPAYAAFCAQRLRTTFFINLVGAPKLAKPPLQCLGVCRPAIVTLCMQQS